MLEAACSDERSRDSGEMSSDPIRRESRILIAAAQKTKCLLEELALLSKLLEMNAEVDALIRHVLCVNNM
jgi:hypothetical protein